MNAFTEIRLHRQWVHLDPEEQSSDEIKTADQDTLEKLLAANTDAKLREFTAEWFPFINVIRPGYKPVFDEEVNAASSTRELMTLVLRLKQMIDEDNCTKDAFEKLGAYFSRGGTEKHEQGNLYFLFASPELADYLRNTNHSHQIEEKLNEKIVKIDGQEMPMGSPELPPFATIGYTYGHVIKTEHLYVEGQEDYVSSLNDDELYPVMPIFGGNLRKDISYSPTRAYFFIDIIMRYCFQGVRVSARNGVIDASADTNFTSMWLRLSETFSSSRVTMCRTCGLPIIAINERGAKRLYCDDSCKRKYKRAQRFATLVSEGMDESSASKEAGIAAKTAYDILKRQPSNQSRP